MSTRPITQACFSQPYARIVSLIEINLRQARFVVTFTQVRACYGNAVVREGKKLGTGQPISYTLASLRTTIQTTTVAMHTL